MDFTPGSLACRAIPRDGDGDEVGSGVIGRSRNIDGAGVGVGRCGGQGVLLRPSGAGGGLGSWTAGGNRRRLRVCGPGGGVTSADRPNIARRGDSGEPAGRDRQPPTRVGRRARAGDVDDVTDADGPNIARPGHTVHVGAGVVADVEDLLRDVIRGSRTQCQQ